jgi:hypothetical protein
MRAISNQNRDRLAGVILSNQPDRACYCVRFGSIGIGRYDAVYAAAVAGSGVANWRRPRECDASQHRIFHIAERRFEQRIAPFDEGS